jgi:hypothetical protein
MDNDFGIKNTVDLYRRLLPALNSKKREIERLKVKNIRNEDIWNFLIKYKWKTVTGLNLSDMVDDILNYDNQELINNITRIKNNNEGKNTEAL